MDIIANLKLLNAKERYHLFNLAIDKKELKIGKHFAKTIENLINVAIPDKHFAAIDYHINWLYAALSIDVLNDNNEHEINNEIFKSNIEDVDLIIVFEKCEGYCIIMIEAKLTDCWTNNQVNSKITRLNTLFDNIQENNIETYFILMSPMKSEGLVIENTKRWLDAKNKPMWIKMESPTLYMLTKSKKESKYWKVKKR